MDENIDEMQQATTFEKITEFINSLDTLLAIDLAVSPSFEEEKAESLLLGNLINILNEYQEQPYLLDPFLERLVVPVIQKLKEHAEAFAFTSRIYSLKRVEKISSLLYELIKFRGHKTIIKFFPHEVRDLSVALNFINTTGSAFNEPSQWALRFVVLLWLSLICMLPFDLAQFDESVGTGTTYSTMELLAKAYLENAGLERVGSSLLLSRLFMRKDTVGRLPQFLSWAQEKIQSSTNVFLGMATLQIFAEIAKHGPFDILAHDIYQIRNMSDQFMRDPNLFGNTIIRKLRVKLLSRTAIRLLPVSIVRISNAKDAGQILDGERISDLSIQEDASADFPQEVENSIEVLFEAIQDKDTSVRWSAAKGLARISERLPQDFSNQVLTTILGLFSIHGSSSDSPRSLPALAESSWHGASLACAEMSRRGLISESHLPDLIQWLLKALFFDIRKGSHSIGSSVRDASAYVFWSLARAQNSPTILKPFAIDIAKSLIVVSLFDRDISIRRAASAAFQESVGRTSLFPNGIAILGETDFYSISNRRNAFLFAAPRVAKHIAYRFHLIDHLLNIGLSHWDIDMRQLSSQSLVKICESDLPQIGPLIIARMHSLLSSVDLNGIHGGILALTELARAYKVFQGLYESESSRRNIFQKLAIIPLATILSLRQHIILEAACYLISESICINDIDQDTSSVPHWRKIVDEGTNSRNGDVQEAASTAMSAVSKLVDCSAFLKRSINDFSTASPMSQRSLTKILGKLDYIAFPHGVNEAIACLLEGVDNSSPRVFMDVEARRDAYNALHRIIMIVRDDLSNQISADVMRSIYAALQNGLEDYTMTEQGDVGSWVRVTSIQGLCSVSQTLFIHATSIPNFAEYLPPEIYHEVIGGILKQSVERLDNVRQQAGESFLYLLRETLPRIDAAEYWRIEGNDLLITLFNEEPGNWRDGAWLFPKAVQMLNIQRYRQPILKGLVLSIGSKTDSIHRPLSCSFAKYAEMLPVLDDRLPYDLFRLVQDLTSLMQSHINQNGVFIPLLQTLNNLFDRNIIMKLETSFSRHSIGKILDLCAKNLIRIKNMQRVIESMKCIVHLVTFAETRKEAILMIEQLLQHKYPKVRADTAEFLYLTSQTKDLLCGPTDVMEEILLRTEWSSRDLFALVDPAEKVVASLQR